MTADRPFELDEPAHAADEALIAALAFYDESLDTGQSALGDATLAFNPDLDDRFVRLRGVLDELARWREAETPRPAGESLANASEPGHAATAPTDDDAPRRIGRFVILEELGRGGHGIVFRARDPVLAREVALKVPRPELLLSDAARKRFLREGRSTASLAHPSLVTVFEAGEAGPVCYLAQEYCAGPNLEAWLCAQHGAVPMRQAAELVAQLAEGVDHAHRRGVVHRDLKPGNVLMQPTTRSADMNHPAAAPTAGSSESTNWTPRIVDFGLAQLEEGSVTLTATGALVGTPAYMAPEQLEPARGEVGPASDIYALGGILFQVLTGQTPYRGASQTELIKQILLDPPRSPRSLRREVPPDLDAICLRALEKRPADRYVTAGDLADDLRRFLRGEPTLARPLTRGERVMRWARRKPWAAALVVVICLSLASMGAMAGIYTARLRAALTASEASRQAMRLQYYASDIQRAHEALHTRRPSDAIALLEAQIPAPGDTDLREFCWGYLWQQTHQASRELRAGRGATYCTAYCLDGKQILSAGQDGVMRVWDAATGQLLQELAEHKSEINALAVSPDGQHLATVSDAGELILWKISNGVQVDCRLKLSDAELWAAAFSPDGSLAVAGEDAKVRIVSVADGQVSQELVSGRTGPVFAVAFWDGGRQLASGDRDGVLLNWNLAAKAMSPEVWLDDLKRPIRAMAFAPDSQHVALALDDIKVMNMPPTSVVARLRGRVDAFTAVRFSPDGQVVLAGNLDSSWWLWRWKEQNDDSRGHAGHLGRVYAVEFSPSGEEFVTAGADGLVRAWPTNTAGLEIPSTLERPKLSHAVLSGDGQMALLATQTSLEACAWRDNAWQSVQRFEFADTEPLRRVAISHDGRWIARTAGLHEVYAWQLNVSREWQFIGRVEDGIDCLDFSRAHDLLLTTSIDSVTAWKLAASQIAWHVPIIRSDMRSLATTNSLAICASGNEVQAIDLVSGRTVFSDRRPQMEFYTVAVTNDGTELFAGGSDRLIHRWRLTDGRSLEPWPGHSQRIKRLAVHPNGRTLASVEEGGRLSLWHRDTGRILLGETDRLLEMLAFTADGRFMNGTGLRRNNTVIWTATTAWPRGASRPPGE